MINLTIPQTIGYLTTVIAVLVKIIGFPDQIKKNYILKSTSGLSTIYFVLAFVSYLLWTVHGLYQKDSVLVIGQGFGLLTTGVIIYQIFIYKKNIN